MRRTRQVTSMFSPEIYRLLEELEPNISWYIYELTCLDLMRRGKLTMQQWMELQNNNEPATATPTTSTPAPSDQVNPTL